MTPTTCRVSLEPSVTTLTRPVMVYHNVCQTGLMNRTVSSLFLLYPITYWASDLICGVVLEIHIFPRISVSSVILILAVIRIFFWRFCLTSWWNFIFVVVGPMEDPRHSNMTLNMINRVSRVLRFYEDSSWAWKETFTK